MPTYDPGSEYRFPQLLESKAWLDLPCPCCGHTMSWHITVRTGKIRNECGHRDCRLPCRDHVIHSASRWVPSRDGKTSKSQQEETTMFTMFQCSIFDPKKGKIIVKPYVIIATNQESARMSLILDNAKALRDLSVKVRDRLEFTTTPLK